MFAIEAGGLDEAAGRLDRLPGALVSALSAKAAELAATLADRVKTGKLAGEVLNLRSGALQASIAAAVSADGDGFVAAVGSIGDVKYAAIQEYGGKTGAHEILPSKAHVLAFMGSGAQRYAWKVQHPGSAIPERSYLRASLDEMSDDIVAALSDVAVEAWG